MLKKIISFFKVDELDYYLRGSNSAIFLDIKKDIQFKFNKRYQSFSILKFNKLPSYQKLINSDVLVTREFTFWLIKNYLKINGRDLYKNEYEGLDDEFKSALIFSLLKNNNSFSDSDYEYCLSFYKDIRPLKDFEKWLIRKVIKVLIRGLETKIKKEGISDDLILFLERILSRDILKTYYQNNYYSEDVYEIRKKIKEILNIGNSIPKFFFNPDDFGNFANQLLENKTLKEKEILYQIIAISSKVTGGKPNKEFLKLTLGFITSVGEDIYKEFIGKILKKVITVQPEKINKTYSYNGQAFVIYKFIEKENINTIKGLIWTLINFRDKRINLLVAQLAEKSFEKLPEISFVSEAIGNSCLYSLTYSKDGIGLFELRMLKEKINRPVIKKRIDKMITERDIPFKISKRILK